MMRFSAFFLFLLCCSMPLNAQTETDIQLAQYYYLNGEFSKALVYYEPLYNSEPNKVYFSRFLDCLIKTGDKKGAEKLFKKYISLHASDIVLKIEFYFFYKELNEADKAKKVKNEILKGDFFNPREFEVILDNLLAIEEYDWAKQMVDKGKKNMGFYPFEIWYAQISKAEGNNLEALEYFLKALGKDNNLKEQIQIEIASTVDFSKESEEVKQVKNCFLSASQKDPTNAIYSEMLIWFFIQSKNFQAAFQQCVAYEKRNKGDGMYLIDFAKTCLENNEYELAIKALNEVINQNFLFKYIAEEVRLNVYFSQITTQRKFTENEISEVLKAYEEFLSSEEEHESGRDKILLEYTEILGFYANQAQKARIILEQRCQEKGLTDIQKARFKLKLADVCVVMDSIWEASLLYMQISDAFKFEPIGNEAKFKNARIFYFDGEFDYAQSQLDVLKQATSKFISNDAMQLSLLILENYGLDSNYEAMSAYAKSELLLLQHKYQEAFQWMDSIRIKYPQSVLNDDILFLKGKANSQQGDWENALSYFQQLVATYPTELLADDALYQLATIHYAILKDNEKALTYFLTIIDKYPGSIYSEETRLMIRRLRGDKVAD